MSQWVKRILKTNPSAQVAVVGVDSYANIQWGATAVIAEAALLAQDVAIARDAKASQLERQRDAACEVDVTVQGKTFSGKPGIQTAITRLAARLRRGKPTTLSSLFEVNGSHVSPVTQALLDGIEDAVAANTEAAWNKYGTLLQQVAAAQTVEAVNAVTW